MATVSSTTVVSVKVCDLCREPLGGRSSGDFQFTTQYKEERPLKQKWYHVLRYAFDGKPTYDVHHTCLYRLVRAYMEGDLVRPKGESDEQ